MQYNTPLLNILLHIEEEILSKFKHLSFQTQDCSTDCGRFRQDLERAN